MGWTNFANLEKFRFTCYRQIESGQNNPKLTTINAPLATKFNTYTDGELNLGNNPMLSILNIDFSLVTKGDWCFNEDAGLNGQYLEFPNVTEIGVQAFGNNAINFVFANNSIITLSGYGWFSSYTEAKLYVPDNLVDTYKTTSGWSDIANQIKGISQLPIINTRT